MGMASPLLDLIESMRTTEEGFVKAWLLAQALYNFAVADTSFGCTEACIGFTHIGVMHCLLQT
jgi:hypothetical protein